MASKESMDSFDFTDYFILSVDRGDIDALKDLWRKSVAMGTTGTEIRNMINERLPSIAKCYGYNREFVSFKELVAYHEDVTSPLRTMPICNGYILFSISQKIPYTKEEFFRLLKKTSLKGVKSMLETLQYNDYIDYTSSIRERFTFVSKFVGGGIATELWRPRTAEEDPSHYIVHSVQELDVLDCYFDPSASPLRELTSNDCKIHTNTDDVIGKVIDMIENERSGFLTIDGIDNDGELVPHMVYEDSSKEYWTISCCLYETALHLNLDKDYHETNGSIEYYNHVIVIVFPSLCEHDYPDLLKRSVIGFEIIAGSYEAGMDGLNFDTFVLGNKVAYYQSEYINFCFLENNADVLYLCIEEPLIEEEVELTNEVTYKIGRLVCEIPEYMYCYELRKA